MGSRHGTRISRRISPGRAGAVIEKALREGHVRAVVTTNALELGIDIGGLDVALMAAIPGPLLQRGSAPPRGTPKRNVAR